MSAPRWLAFPLLGVFGIGAYVFTGSGEVIVVGPARRRVTVVIDEVNVGELKPGEQRRFELSHGAHELRLGDTIWEVDVDRWYRRVLQVGAQCFVVFDVTNLLYELRGGREARAVWDRPVRETHFAIEPFELPERTFLDGELPARMEYQERANVLREVPCSMKDAPEEALNELAPTALPFLR